MRTNSEHNKSGQHPGSRRFAPTEMDILLDGGIAELGDIVSLHFEEIL